MKYLINAPVVDLRKEPANNGALESQLLYGEKIEIVTDCGEWVQIKALEQEKCLENVDWTPYPGWIEKKYIQEVTEFPHHNLVVHSNFAHIPMKVSLGTYLAGIREYPDHWSVQLVDGNIGAVDKKDVWVIEDRISTQIIDKGRTILGVPYLWGGRTSDAPDCSGLVNLLYRIHGIKVPRDAHDQFLKAQRRSYEELVPGDLVFTAPQDKPNRMTHVMLYSGNGCLLEATAASGNVREIPASVRFGCPISEVVSGQCYNDAIVHFGSFAFCS